MADATLSLASLTGGLSAIIAEINTSSEDRSRLMELGLVPGTVVEVVRYAPMGDPLEIKVRGYLLTLRRHEAELIRVTPKV